ncbi:MAG: hypothetical protein F4039_10615 [Gammaproteobacteria bacterium]|nr:hypothetical protein [Gammaproteobacteria bacterium]
MKVNIRITAWLSACFCLILLTLGAFLWLSTSRAITTKPPPLSTNTNQNTSPNSTVQLADVLSTHTTDAEPTKIGVKRQTVTLTIPPLPPVDYLLGSIGEACAVNEYPSRVEYHEQYQEHKGNLANSPFDSDGEWKSFKDEKCRAALETKTNSINPYLWGRESDTHGNRSALALVTIDNPLTFERIFSDPAGDFARVQEALVNPECQLSQDTATNWELKESCHADAFLNYALIRRFCNTKDPHFGVTRRDREYYRKADNPTPEQDRIMWIQALEDAWVMRKCDSLDLNLDLQLPEHTELRQQIEKFQVYEKNENRRKQTLNGTLIELAARLGDEAAGLTYPVKNDRHRPPYDEEGYKYGPLAQWFTTDLSDPTNLFSKLAPSVDRFRHLVPLFGKNIKTNGKVINFDHQVLAQHLCTPPYHIPPSDDETPTPEPSNCREIINKLRQEESSPSILEAITTFEDVAIRIDVYE